VGMNLGSKNSRGISSPAEESISFSRRTLLHGIGWLNRKMNFIGLSK